MEVSLLLWFLLLGQASHESPPENIKELLAARRDIIAQEVEQHRKQLTVEVFGPKDKDLKALEDRLQLARAELKDGGKGRGRAGADKTALRQVRADVAKRRGSTSD